MKKQIVFIEAKPTVYTYKLARTLKLSGKYETVLVCFSEIDKDFYSKAYDEFHILEWSHKPNFKNFVDFFRKIFGKKGRAFFRKIKKMKPYVFQITGPDLFSLIMMYFLRKNKSPKIYFAYDIWGLDKRNFLFMKNPGIRGCFQKIFERICFKIADGVLHKGRPGELKLLDYNINLPDLSFVPGCLDEWICPVKNRKQDRKIRLVYAGGPWSSQGGISPFSNIIGSIAPQKIYLDAFGSFFDKKEEELFYKKIKKNEYFSLNKKERADKLNKKLSEYNYGIILHFYDSSVSSLTSEKEMANRLFNYIEAGIPIIINKQLKFMANIVDNNQIGFCIDYKDLKNLKEILLKQDYKKMRKNMIKAREKFRLSKMIKDLEKFYEEVKNEN